VIAATAIVAYSAYRQYTLIPVLGLLCCMYLMIEIPANSWMVFLCWMGAGLIVYFLFGYKNSKLNKANVK